VYPGVVIFATGMPPDLAGLRLSLPADLVKGHLFVTAPTDLHLTGTVASVATALDGGRLLVGGSLDIEDVSTGVRDQVIARMRSDLAAALPAAAGISVTNAWCCWRPHHPDGLPVIDRVPELDNAWLTSGHYRTGILAAPATSELLVEWITTGRRPSRAAPFSASRFTDRLPPSEP